jgi:hypothetical protein
MEEQHHAGVPLGRVVLGQGVPALNVLGGWPFDLVLQRLFQNVNDLLAPMGVLDYRRFRADVDARLDDLASGDAEILLEIGAPQSRRLLDRHAHSSSLTQGPERRPELGREQLRLFPGGEVAAPVDLVEVDEIR